MQLSEALLENRNPHTRRHICTSSIFWGNIHLLLADDYEDKDVSLPASDSAAERLKVSS